MNLKSKQTLFLAGMLLLSIFLLKCNSAEIQKNDSEITGKAQIIRFASYNVAMFRNQAGQLAEDLASGRDTQIQNVAAVIQHVRPDVLALMEFDYDSTGTLLKSFQQNYLGIGQHGEKPITYAFSYSFPSNTGVPSNLDLNDDGKTDGPEDAFGYGRYEGQYAFALFSKYPLNLKKIRSFQKLRWKDLPDAKQPINPDSNLYYDENEWNLFRISSKNHIDIPVQLPDGKLIHTILAHPTPPVFDGPEDRNGLRNFDEIRLLKDYIAGADYLRDDSGKAGGLANGSSFVIMGDLNADPVDGDSAPGAITQLLDHPLINQAVVKGDFIPKSKGGKAHNQRKEDKGDPAFDTAFFGKRIDYVLPSKDLKVTGSGVFWPVEGEALYEQVRDKRASDHLLVWVDLEVN